MNGRSPHLSRFVTPSIRARIRANAAVVRGLSAAAYRARELPCAFLADDGRCLAYENAGRALRVSGKPEEAKQLLQQAAEQDPGCRHSIALRISHINRTDTASSSVRRAGP